MILYVSRVLGPRSLGELSFAQAMLTYFGVFTDLGLTTLAIREIARHPEETSRIAISATAAQLAVAIILQAPLAGLIAVLPVSGPTKALTLVYGLTLIPQALSLAYVLQAQERMLAVAVLRILIQVGSVGAGIVALAATGNLVVVPVTAVIVNLAADVVAIALLRRTGHLTIEKPDPSLTKQLLRQGAPFVVTGITIQLLLNFDAVVIGAERGEKELGIYSAAYKIIVIMLGVGAMLMNAVFPRMSALAHETELFKTLFQRVARLVGFISLPMSVAVAGLAPVLIPVLYGPRYSRAIPVLAILCAVPLIGLYNIMLAHAVVAIGRQLLQMWVNIGAAAVNIALNLLLIPLAGIVGAAWANVASESTEVVLFILIVGRLLPTLGLAEVASSVPMGVGIGVVILVVGPLLHLSAWAQLGLTLAAFAALMVAMRAGPFAEVLSEVRWRRRVESP